MADDWDWFWANEGGRDRILRDEVEGLHARLSSASAQTSRLSSQLAKLSGSLESRLTALSRAFDAYVELGDVREALTAYEEPAAMRRDVASAIDALAGGRPPTKIDPRGLDYWLPYAMNAVVDVAAGQSVRAELDRARALAPEADLFVVATSGALGHGPAVADLLPGVLTADQELTDDQCTIWRAAATGSYGELTDGLAASWRPLLEQEPAAGWTAWVTAHAPSPSAGLIWLDELTGTPDEVLREPVVAPPDQGSPVPRSSRPDATSAQRGASPTPAEALRTVVTGLVQRGMPAETDLLRRSRELRALIENPGSGRRPAEQTEPATVGSEVRRALLQPSTAPAVRHTLVSWVVPSLLAVVDELEAVAKASPPSQETLRGYGRGVVVTPTGVDSAVVADALARVGVAYRVTNRSLIGWSVTAAAAALLTLVLGLSGSGWAWLFGLGLIAAGVGGGLQLRHRRATRRAGAEAVDRLRQDIAKATARVESSEEQRTALLVQVTGQAADLRDRLAPLARSVVGRA